MDLPQDFKSMQDQIQAALVTTTRTVAQLSSEDLAFQRTLNPDVGPSLDDHNSRLLALSSSLIKAAAALSDLKSPILKELDDVENNWHGVVDVLDSLLERADSSLDEYTGVIKRKLPSNDQEAPVPAKRQLRGQGTNYRNLNLVKPQLAFDIKPDNFDTTVWKPLLKTKPNAVVPLQKSLEIVKDDSGNQHYRHPYETEIQQLQYPKFVYETADPTPYLPFESTTAIFVDTYQGVLEMLAELKQAREIAVDLEHHDFRSYIGLVSLMQISTRRQDWIVDTLKPWRQDLQILNEVFTDPKILKVFHGAFMDIEWLQRDLGLYIVGLFDTYHAGRALGHSQNSLAHLLHTYVGFEADKQYQMADWRIRPLPQEMFYYARADTHYLLFIYDRLRNELITRSDINNPEENRIGLALQHSKETSLTRYEPSPYHEDSGSGKGGWYKIVLKDNRPMNGEQFAVFKAVHAWRDKIARIDDDSTNYVMPINTLFNIALILPVDLMALTTLVKPTNHSVKSRLNELWELVQAAKVAGKDGPTLMDILRPDSIGAITKNVQKEIPGLPSGQQGHGLLKVDNALLRSEKSAFWGNAFGSSSWERSSENTKDHLVARFSIPLPDLLTEKFVVGHRAAMPERVREVVMAPILPPTTNQVVEEQPFRIKGGSTTKRKRDSEVSAVSDEEQIDNSDKGFDITFSETGNKETSSERAARKAAKAARKAEKKLLKAQKQGEKVEKHGDLEEEEPFDYTKAKSVLNSKPIPEQGRKRAKPFDPYTKSGDAAKGMRRTQTERPGKSFTFKS